MAEALRSQSPSSSRLRRALRCLIYAAPLLGTAAWLGGVLFHPYPLAFSLHLALAGVVGWTAVFAWRPALSVGRLWTLVALFGLAATSTVSIGADLDRRWARIESVCVRYRLADGRRADALEGRLLGDRARSGDAIALEAMIERLRVGEDVFTDLRVLREMTEDSLFERAYLVEGSEIVRAARRTPPRLRRSDGWWMLHDALGELRQAEMWLAAVEPELDAWRDAVVDDADALLLAGGKRPRFDGTRWLAGQADPAGWPGPVPWEVLGRLDDPGARAGFRADWAAAMKRRGGAPLEVAALHLELGEPDAAVGPLREARAEAILRGDQADLARAAVWMAFATREPDERARALGEARREGRGDWPEALAVGLLRIEASDDAVAGSMVPPAQTTEGYRKLWGAREGCEDQLDSLPDETGRQLARPERAALLEVILHLEARMDEGSPCDDHLDELRQIRPGLAVGVKRVLRARRLEERRRPFPPPIAPLLWGSRTPW